jgi:hypothetical protein
MARLWHYNGIPEFLFRQAARLGIGSHQADLARHNKEIHRLSTLVNQLCERYHKARKEDGEPVFGSVEIAGIKETLGACERELEKLHILAASAEEMLRSVYNAFDVDAPDRPFIILAASDDASTSVVHCNGAPVGAEAVADSVLDSDPVP